MNIGYALLVLTSAATLAACNQGPDEAAQTKAAEDAVVVVDCPATPN